MVRHTDGNIPTNKLIVARNTTESLDTVISGFDQKTCGEAVMTQQDYGSMPDQLKLMARRHGIKNQMVSVLNHPKTDDEIVPDDAGVTWAKHGLKK